MTNPPSSPEHPVSAASEAPSAPSIAHLYRVAQASCVELLRSLTPAELAMPMHALPGWTVRDTISHVAGIPDDGINGRMAGAPGEEWTAAQVERWRDTPVEELLDQWDAQAPLFAEAIQSMGEGRPPIDCHAHEQDIRGAIGQPGNRSHELITYTSTGMILGMRLDRPLLVELQDGTVLRGGSAEGTAEPLVLRGMTRFEIFRSRLGRRSAAQVANYDWSDNPADALASWFIFGPAATAVVE